MDDLIYFVNSRGKTTYLATPNNRNCFVLAGRYGFSAPEVDIFTQKFVSGKTEFFGKALKPRTCGLQMLVRGKDQAERDNIFYSMLDVLLDADGEGEGKLYVKRSDGSMVCLNCIYSSGMRAADQYKNFRSFAVEFYAADPWFYVERKNNIYTDELDINDVTVNWNITPSYWVEMEYKYDGIGTDTYFMAGVSVPNVGSSSIQLWTEDLTAGDTLVISTKDGVSYVRDEYGKKTFYKYLSKLLIPAGTLRTVTPLGGGSTAIREAFAESTYTIKSNIAGV